MRILLNSEPTPLQKLKIAIHFPKTVASFNQKPRQSFVQADPSAAVKTSRPSHTVAPEGVQRAPGVYLCGGYSQRGLCGTGGYETNSEVIIGAVYSG
jgi:hypothetical protein